MNAIRIIDVPPGFAPHHIRAQWVGVVIPLPTKEEMESDPPAAFGIGSANRNGPLVLREKAVEVLRMAGRDEAADFWSSLSLGRFLQFRPDVVSQVEL